MFGFRPKQVQGHPTQQQSCKDDGIFILRIK